MWLMCELSCLNYLLSISLQIWCDFQIMCELPHLTCWVLFPQMCDLCVNCHVLLTEYFSVVCVQPGYGDISQGCIRCSCSLTGSVSRDCDPVTGQCRCRMGIGGSRCDRCAEGYFGFSQRGCRRKDWKNMAFLDKHVEVCAVQAI